MQQADIPELPGPSLTREDVRARCLRLKAAGWDVFRKGETFIITTGPIAQVTLEPADRGGCNVRGIHESGVSLSSVFVRNLAALDDLLRQRGVAGSGPPRSTIRTRLGEPATNISRIASLMGARVEAVHDPFLDDPGLKTLLTLAGFGQGVAPNLRLLTSLSVGNRLTEAMLRATLRELKATQGQMRRTTNPKPHRRFMLLSGGQSLILGMSLNDLDKDEAARLEPDTEDRRFFDAEWEGAVAP